MLSKLTLFVLFILLHYSNTQAEYKCASQLSKLLQNFGNQSGQEINQSEKGFLSDLFGSQAQPINRYSLSSELTALDILNLDSCNLNSNNLFPLTAECRQSLWDLSAIWRKLLDSSDSPFFYSINLALLKYTFESSVKKQCNNALKVLNLTQKISPQCIANLVKASIKSKIDQKRPFQERFSLAKQSIIESLSSCGQVILAERVSSILGQQCENALIRLLGQVHSLKEQRKPIQQSILKNNLEKIHQLTQKTKQVCKK